MKEDDLTKNTQQSWWAGRLHFCCCWLFDIFFGFWADCKLEYTFWPYLSVSGARTIDKMHTSRIAYNCSGLASGPGLKKTMVHCQSWNKWIIYQKLLDVSQLLQLWGLREEPFLVEQSENNWVLKCMKYKVNKWISVYCTTAVLYISTDCHDNFIFYIFTEMSVCATDSAAFCTVT